MKTKNIFYVCFGALFLIFTSCDNLIEKAPTATEKMNTETYTYFESFKKGFGEFSQYNSLGKQNWVPSTEYQYVMMNGNVENIPYANEDWLISPAIALPEGLTSVVSFDYVTRGFADISNDVSIWVSEDYIKDSIPSRFTWTRINTVDPMSNSAGWKMSNSGDISLKQFKGKKVSIAFKYISGENQAGILQVCNFAIKDRTPVMLPYTETFVSSKGKFVAINVSGNQSWTIDSHGYIAITGYINSVNNANEDWLISPQIDFTKVQNAKLTFDHVTRYFGNYKTDPTLWYSEDYEEGLPSEATWKRLKTYPFGDSGNWSLSTSNEITLDSCVGKKVSIAFKYLSTTTKAGTWEIKNFVVKEGIPSDIYFYEAFDSNLGNFTTDDKLGAQKWIFSNSGYALASGFANGISNANEDWLISPSIDLTGKTSAKLSFDYTINKGLVANLKTNHTLWMSADNGTTWEQITIPVYPTGANWTFVNSGNIVIPEKYLGISSFKFAFKYLCSATESASWEIKNVTVKP